MDSIVQLSPIYIKKKSLPHCTHNRMRFYGKCVYMDFEFSEKYSKHSVYSVLNQLLILYIFAHKKKMWTLKNFEKVYDRFQSSGLKIREFCQNECILESKFYYWKNKLRKHNHRLEEQPGFVPIVFTGSNQPLPVKKTVLQKQNREHVESNPGNCFEIVYPNGVMVRIPVGTDIKQLQSLIYLSR